MSDLVCFVFVFFKTLFECLILGSLLVASHLNFHNFQFVNIPHWNKGGSGVYWFHRVHVSVYLYSSMLSDCTFSLMCMCFCSESHVTTPVYSWVHHKMCMQCLFPLRWSTGIKADVQWRNKSVHYTCLVNIRIHISMTVAHFIQQVKAHKDQERLQLICKYTLDCRGVHYMCSVIHLWLGRILGQGI